MKILCTKRLPKCIRIRIQELDDLLSGDDPLFAHERSDDGSVLDIRHDRPFMATENLRGFLDSKEFCHWIRISRGIPVSLWIFNASFFPNPLLPVK